MHAKQLEQQNNQNNWNNLNNWSLLRALWQPTSLIRVLIGLANLLQPLQSWLTWPLISSSDSNQVQGQPIAHDLSPRPAPPPIIPP